MGQALCSCLRRQTTKTAPDEENGSSAVAHVGVPTVGTGESALQLEKKGEEVHTGAVDLSGVQTTSPEDEAGDVDLSSGDEADGEGPTIPLPPPKAGLDSLPVETIRHILAFLGTQRLPLNREFFALFAPDSSLVLAACRRGFAAYLQLVLQANPDALENCADRCRMTALHHASESGSSAAVELMLKHVAAHVQASSTSTGAAVDNEVLQKMANALDVWKCVPLHRVRTAEVCKLLCDIRGAKLDAVTRADVKDTRILAGDAPLHVSVRYDLPEVTSVLIAAKADLNLANRNGESPLDVAVETRSERCGALLVQKGATRAIWGARKMTWYQAVETQLVFLIEYMKRKGCPNPINALHDNIETALHLACRRVMPEVCRILLEAKADATIRDQRGRTALHRAADLRFNNTGFFFLTASMPELDKDPHKKIQIKQNQGEEDHTCCLATVQQLLDNCPKILTYSDNEKVTPLMHAAASGSLQLVKLLLSDDILNRVNVDFGTAGGSSPSSSKNKAGGARPSSSSSRSTRRDEEDLSPTTSQNNGSSGAGSADGIEDQEAWLVVQKRQKRMRSLLRNRDTRLRSALHYACTGADCVCIVEFLIRNGADPKLEDESERLPFLTAVSQGSCEVVKWFLESASERGAAEVDALLNAVDQKLQTPLMLAAGNPEILEVLLKRYIPPDASMDEAGSASRAIAYKSVIEAQDWEGRTAAHIACQHGDSNSLKLLHETGRLSVHESMDWGWTCLMLACDRGSTSCIRYLLAEGVDLAARRSDGSTAILVLGKTDRIADAKDMLPILELLGGTSSNQNLITDDTETSSLRTLMHFVAGNAHIKTNHHLVLHFLINISADCNRKDSVQWTPLHYCCQRGDSSSVELLLRSGAVDSPDDTGTTAKKLAEKCGHHHLLNLFADRELSQT
ncbi:unnamed protein product [Amoebophrya sp. A25]|nr:unnamed protein product [Amoebophrya sp. A25]|eukprot:GSA25T00000892001.1